MTALNKWFRYSILLCFIGMTLPAMPQQLQASLKHYSTDDGMTSNAISYIVQDDLGFIWIATWNGLSRFDGFNFVNYETGAISHIPLLHNRIIDLKVDQQQNIWMRMYDGRIFVLNRKTDRIINAMEGIAGYQEMRTSNPLFLTSKGEMMVIIDNIGIYRMRLTPNGMQRTLITTGNLMPKVIVEGYQGDLWVGTEQGFHRLNADDESLEKKGIFTEEAITCAYSNGYNIFAGTASGTLITFAYGQEPKVLFKINERFHSVLLDSHDNIWFTNSGQGVNQYISSTGEIKEYRQWVPVPEFDVNGARISEVNGVIWASMSHGGFGYYNRAADRMEYFHNNPDNPWDLSNTVAAYLTLPEGVVWESTSKRGLEKLDILKKKIIRKRPFGEDRDSTSSSRAETQSLISRYNEIRALYYDRERKLLLVGNKLGTLKIISSTGQAQTLTGTTDGKSFGRIYSIHKDSKGRYWLCTKGNGLFMMVPQAGGGYSFRQFEHIEGNKNTLNSNNVYDMVEDKQGNIWIATYGDGVNLLIEDKNGTFRFLNKDNGINTYPHNAYHKVRTVCTDTLGNVWAGTTDGILLMKYQQRAVDIKRMDMNVSHEYPLACNDIICIDRSPRGEMWIGTNGGGLSHCTGIDSEGKWCFENIYSKQGLPSDEIRSITFDKQDILWLATDHIICSYDATKKVFSTFSIQDGVDNTICSENSAITMDNGVMCFGTFDGYYVLNKNTLSAANAAMLKLRITDFLIDDEVISPRTSDLFEEYIPECKKVTLPYHGCRFAFRFASLNYQLQHRVHYQYMLEGYDETWKDADVLREAQYEDVPGGTYTLRIRAFLLETPNKYDERTIEVVMPPHFLLSTSAIWIYMGIAALLLLITLFWKQEKMKRLKRKQEEQTA